MKPELKYLIIDVDANDAHNPIGFELSAVIVWNDVDLSTSLQAGRRE